MLPDFDYLKALLKETERLRESFPFREISEEDAEITYITTKLHTTIGTQCGLMHELALKKYKVSERPKLRKGSMNYCKIYRIDGKVVRVDSYVKGRVDVVFLAYYQENKRFLFPFRKDGGFYPTYTYVTHFKNDMVTEEYQSDSVQIVYNCYEKTDENHVWHDCINYVPNGTHPVLASQSGIFALTPELTYQWTEAEHWRDGKQVNTE